MTTVRLCDSHPLLALKTKSEHVSWLLRSIPSKTHVCDSIQTRDRIEPRVTSRVRLGAETLPPGWRRALLAGARHSPTTSTDTTS
jgi:hypothetical protein